MSYDLCAEIRRFSVTVDWVWGIVRWILPKLLQECSSKIERFCWVQCVWQQTKTKQITTLPEFIIISIQRASQTNKKQKLAFLEYPQTGLPTCLDWHTFQILIWVHIVRMEPPNNYTTWKQLWITCRINTLPSIVQLTIVGFGQMIQELISRCLQRWGMQAGKIYQFLVRLFRPMPVCWCINGDQLQQFQHKTMLLNLVTDFQLNLRWSNWYPGLPLSSEILAHGCRMRRWKCNCLTRQTYGQPGFYKILPRGWVRLVILYLHQPSLNPVLLNW